MLSEETSGNWGESKFMNDIFKSVLTQNKKHQMDEKLAMGLMNRLQDLLRNKRYEQQMGNSKESTPSQLNQLRHKMDTIVNENIRNRLLRGRASVIDLTLMNKSDKSRVSIGEYKSILNQVNLVDKLQGNNSYGN